MDDDEAEADTLPMIPIYEKHPPLEERHGYSTSRSAMVTSHDVFDLS